VRQNTSTLLESIRVVEHEELVEHTLEERLIYRQSCHDNDIFNLESGYEDIGLDARAALLQRCAHFSLNKSVEDVAMALQKLGDAKRERIELVEAQLRVEAARAAALGAWDFARARLQASLPLRHPAATAALRELAQRTCEELRADSQAPSAMEIRLETHDRQGHVRLRPEVRLRQPLRDTECYASPPQRHVVVYTVAEKCSSEARGEALQILGDTAVHAQVWPASRDSLKAALGEGLVSVGRLLDAAFRSKDFFDWQLQGLSGQAGEVQHTCSICLDEGGSLGSLAILPCAHVFHTACVWAAVRQNEVCPECRAPVTRHQVKSVVMELAPSDSSTALARAAELSPELQAHGSKLNAVAQCLRRIHGEDPTAKAIVFVQWASLEERVARALDAHGVPCVRVPLLSSRAREASEMIKSFQEGTEEGSPFALLLSLEKAASGTNLTAASHVLFVHPMNAESLSTAVAYERQALARVRRVGQARSEVHVWRFVTRHTVEEHIHRLHRGAPEAGPPEAGPSAASASSASASTASGSGASAARP